MSVTRARVTAHVTAIITRAVGAGFRDLPDAELVAFGRRLCGASMRADPKELERLRGETGVTVGIETTQALTLLCPEVDELTILTADEAMHVCVTVEGYGTRPLVEREGWEKVVEIGYTSPKGERTHWAEAAADLPNPLVKGPGRYRVRVHMRGADAAMKDDGDARQRFLVMIFPGSSRRTEILR